MAKHTALMIAASLLATIVAVESAQTAQDPASINRANSARTDSDSDAAPLAGAEGRIAFLKTELAVTDAQTPQWKAFADALRAGSKTTHETMVGAGSSSAAPEIMDAILQMMTAQLDSVKAIAAAENDLYAILTDTQKAKADELLGGQMTC